MKGLQSEEIEDSEVQLVVTGVDAAGQRSELGIARCSLETLLAKGLDHAGELAVVSTSGATVAQLDCTVRALGAVKEIEAAMKEDAIEIKLESLTLKKAPGGRNATVTVLLDILGLGEKEIGVTRRRRARSNPACSRLCQPQRLVCFATGFDRAFLCSPIHAAVTASRGCASCQGGRGQRAARRRRVIQDAVQEAHPDEEGQGGREAARCADGGARVDRGGLGGAARRAR
eukprot:2555921-Prymnesium_polylepis.2